MEQSGQILFRFKHLDYAETHKQAEMQIHILTHQLHRLKAISWWTNKRLTGLILQTEESVSPVSPSVRSTERFCFTSHQRDTDHFCKPELNWTEGRYAHVRTRVDPKGKLSETAGTSSLTGNLRTLSPHTNSPTLSRMLMKAVDRCHYH